MVSRVTKVTTSRDGVAEAFLSYVKDPASFKKRVTELELATKELDRASDTLALKKEVKNLEEYLTSLKKQSMTLGVNATLEADELVSLAKKEAAETKEEATAVIKQAKEKRKAALELDKLVKEKQAKLDSAQARVDQQLVDLNKEKEKYAALFSEYTEKMNKLKAIAGK